MSKIFDIFKQIESQKPTVSGPVEWMIVGLGVAHVFTAKDTDEEMDHLYF